MRKSMTTVVPMSGGHRVFSKGASEIMLTRCTGIIARNGEVQPFSKSDQETMIREVIEPMASDGLRTICMAYKDYLPEQGK